jgi:hypothetical protein
MAKTTLAMSQPESVSIVEVAFAQPHNISTDDGSMKQYLDAVKVVVIGSGFRQRDTGPVVWLNGEPTLRVLVAEDGSSLEAYFYSSFPKMEAANKGVWNVQIQDYEGADLLSAPGATEVQRLSATERAQLDARKRQFGLQ